jgi:hypothetical protein
MKSTACWLLFLALAPRLMSTTTAATTTQVTVDQGSKIRFPSPNGKWEVDSVTPKTEEGNSSLVLKSGSGRRTLPLGEFFRSGTLIWSSNSQVLLFLDRHSPEDTRLRVFRIPGTDGVQSDSADREIRGSILKLIGSSNRILFYDLEVPSCSEDEFFVTARVVTVSKAVTSGPAKQWDGKYAVHLKPLKVTRESFGVTAEGIEKQAQAH